MLKVVILGGGNLAMHLANVFLKTSDISLVQVYNRTLSHITQLQKHISITNDLETLEKADIYIICVSDHAIELLSSNVPVSKALVVHTSGSTTMDILNSHKRHGVFYPLQTFSKNRKISFKKIPICIESNNSDDLVLLKELASKISKNSHVVNSEQREQLHMAAVFVNNFVNHLYHIGNDICTENKIQPEILQALIQETAKKTARFSPYEAQTGPARRGDETTIKKHLEKLSNNQQEIYKLLSHSIATTYGKKL